jgi:hypothetical protein
MPPVVELLLSPEPPAVDEPSELPVASVSLLEVLPPEPLDVASVLEPGSVGSVVGLVAVIVAVIETETLVGSSEVLPSPPEVEPVAGEESESQPATTRQAAKKTVELRKFISGLEARGP